MKLLYVSHLHLPEDKPLKNIGGMQRVSTQLVKALERNPEVELRTELMKSSWKGIGLKTAGFLLKEWVRLPRTARRFGADAILFSSMVTASLAYFIHRRIDIPMIAINHGKDVTLPFGPYQKFLPGLFERLDGVISVSEATLEASTQRGLDPGKGKALGNGIDLQKMDSFPNRTESRRAVESRIGRDLNNRYLLLTVGRLVKRKGHEWFIRNVFPKIREDTIYVVIGDGSEFDPLSVAVEESRLEDRIFVLGRQKDQVVKQAYAAADLFIMPNIPVEGDMEGFGIVLLEANLAKTPAVASDLEGIKDVIKQEENGFRVQPLNEQKFANTVNNVLNSDLKKLSEQARNYVLDKFNWDRVSRDYLEYIDLIIARYGTRSR